MQQIRLDLFQIVPIQSSIRRDDIPDSVYFSKYKNWISNSKLATICPEQGGSISKWKEGMPKLTTRSLSLGTAIHCSILQPKDFTLSPKIGKPTAKLGDTIDRIRYYRHKGYSIYNSIVQASKDCSYYVNQINSKIKKIIKEGLAYYLKSKDFDDSIITLPDKDIEAVLACINSVKSNNSIMNKIYPKTIWGEDLPTFNEDTIFLDVFVTYKGRYTTLHLKMKADNWNIDVENKLLMLNDVKTTSKPLPWFMNKEYGSIVHYHYARQFAYYAMILEEYAKVAYGYNKSWRTEVNVLAVNTVEYNSRLFNINKQWLEKGKQEYEKLLKMVAYYEIFGTEEEVEFV